LVWCVNFNDFFEFSLTLTTLVMLMNIFIHHEWEIEKPGQIIQYKT